MLSQLVVARATPGHRENNFSHSCGSHDATKHSRGESNTQTDTLRERGLKQKRQPNNPVGMPPCSRRAGSQASSLQSNGVVPFSGGSIICGDREKHRRSHALQESTFASQLCIVIPRISSSTHSRWAAPTWVAPRDQRACRCLPCGGQAKRYCLGAGASATTAAGAGCGGPEKETLPQPPEAAAQAAVGLRVQAHSGQSRQGLAYKAC